MRAILLVALALAAACDSPADVGFERPAGEQFAPPALYDSLYAAMESCAGIAGNFSRVRWFMVPGVSDWTSTLDNQTRVLGQWWPPHDIYIGERTIGTRTAREREVVTHEILHELLQDSEHPDPPYGACAPART